MLFSLGSGAERSTADLFSDDMAFFQNPTGLIGPAFLSSRMIRILACFNEACLTGQKPLIKTSQLEEFNSSLI